MRNLNFWSKIFILNFWSSQCGYVVRTSASHRGDPGSNPIAARKSCEVYPGLGILQPQWNPYPTLTPPSCWVRHVRSIGDPQYGLVVCCVVSACDSTDSREISNDGNPSHPHPHTHTKHWDRFAVWNQGPDRVTVSARHTPSNILC